MNRIASRLDDLPIEMLTMTGGEEFRGRLIDSPRKGSGERVTSLLFNCVGTSLRNNSRALVQSSSSVVKCHRVNLDERLLGQFAMIGRVVASQRVVALLLTCCPPCRVVLVRNCSQRRCGFRSLFHSLDEVDQPAGCDFAAGEPVSQGRVDQSE